MHRAFLRRSLRKLPPAELSTGLMVVYNIATIQKLLGNQKKKAKLGIEPLSARTVEPVVLTTR